MNTVDLTNWEILIVDDEPDNLTVLDTLLNFFDAHVTSAGSGEEALELLKTRTFKLGLFDIQMPKVSGWDLVRWVRGSDTAETRDMCLIAVTALAMPGDEDRILQAGFDGYVAKPIDASVFMDSVNAVITKPRDQRQPAQAKADSASMAENVGISDKMSQVISEVRTRTDRVGEIDLSNVADLLESNGHLLDIRYELEPKDDYPRGAKLSIVKETQESPAVAAEATSENQIPDNSTSNNGTEKPVDQQLLSPSLEDTQPAINSVPIVEHQPHTNGAVHDDTANSTDVAKPIEITTPATIQPVQEGK